MRRYGQWAGDPRGTPENTACCIVEVAEAGRAILFHQCFRKRGKGDGGLFCGQHAAKIQKGWKPWLPEEKGKP